MPAAYYARADAIASQLEHLGYSDSAELLRDAIASGSTGTEILMALRFELNRIATAELSLGDLANDILSLLHEMNIVLDS